jgi:hypothetical protein
MHFAEATLFIDVASLIWAFDIEAPVDDTGKKELPDVDMTNWNGILPWCVPISCRNLADRFRQLSSTIQVILQATLSRGG